MQGLFALLYVAGLIGAVLTFKALARSETSRRGYAYAAFSSTVLTAVLVFGIVG